MKILKISFQIDSKKKDNINLYYIFKVLSINLYLNLIFNFLIFTKNEILYFISNFLIVIYIPK